MRIAVWHNLPSGGGKRALHGHVRGLLERGHEVDAWCPPTRDGSYLPLGGMIRERVVPLDAAGRRGIVPFTAVRKYRRAIGRLQAIDRHCRVCADEINAGDYDVVFVNSCMFTAAAPLGRYVTSPAVLYLQEPLRRLYEARPKLRWVAPEPRQPGVGRLRHWKQFAGEYFEVHAARVQAREELRSATAYRRILVNSHFSRESVLRAYGLDSQVCYLGVDGELFREQGLRRANTVIGIGAFHEAKNIEFVIRAVGEVRVARPRLVWVGNMSDDDYLQSLREMAEGLEVDFEPYVGIPDVELVRLLNEATAMVYAPRLEPFGYAPLEAGRCGLPVVAVAEGGVRETVIDGVNGLLADAEPMAMAQAIERLCGDEQLARRLGRAGRRMVEEQWSLEAADDRLEAHFVEVAGSAPKEGCARRDKAAAAAVGGRFEGEGSGT